MARRFKVDDPTHGFGGNFIETQPTFTVSTQNADATSLSGTGDTTIPSIFKNGAEIGLERNGVFFG